MRLDKFLADRNLGTRSQVKELIRKGLVKVNGVSVKRADIQIKESEDIVAVNGEEVSMMTIHYLMLHKPAGVVSATVDNHEKTVMELLPEQYRKNFFPVGRLDKDTEGLLLITDDGGLAHRLLSPRHHVDKTYYVEANGRLSEKQLAELKHGVDIGDEELTLPAKISGYQNTETGSSFLLTIIEGRYHQIKRMVKAVGCEVTYLKRLTMGALSLDDTLLKGDFRPLTEEEIRLLKNRENA